MKLAQVVGAFILGSMSLPAFASSFDKANNFYIAADTGIFQGTFNNRYLDLGGTIPYNIQQTVTQNGYTAGLAFGYSRLVSEKYFLGGELSANMDGSNATYQIGTSGTNFSDNININKHFDLAFLPGLMLSNDVAAYLKMGLSYALLRDTLDSPTGFDSTITNYYRNTNALGFVAGIGVAKSLAEHFSLFTEANYYDYGTINLPNFENFTATYSHSTHVYSYDVTVGAAYTF